MTCQKTEGSTALFICRSSSLSFNLGAPPKAIIFEYLDELSKQQFIVGNFQPAKRIRKKVIFLYIPQRGWP